MWVAGNHRDSFWVIPVVCSWESSVEIKGDQSSFVALSGSPCLKKLGTLG